MYYHPIIGICIFVVAVILAFILGRSLMKKKNTSFLKKELVKNNSLPEGEVTAPDAPWLDKNK